MISSGSVVWQWIEGAFEVPIWKVAPENRGGDWKVTWRCVDIDPVELAGS